MPNKLEELVSILGLEQDIELLSWAKLIPEKICLLHMNEPMLIDEKLIDIYYHRSKYQSLLPENKRVKGLEALVESFKNNVGRIISIYTLTVGNQTIICCVDLASKKIVGCLVNHELDLEQRKTLWRDYLNRGYLNDNYHVFDKMEELDVITYLK